MADSARPVRPNCPQFAPNLYPVNETLVHTEDFNHWWFQTGAGNGGTFGRSQYVQIFEDLSLMQGNANGQNADPALSFFPPGPKATDPFVSGTVPGTNCSVTISPIAPSNDDTDAMKQQEMMDNQQQVQLQAACAQSRCDPKNVWTAPTGYYDATYNPDGSQQVISFCDGGQVPSTGADAAMSPYLDVWAPPSSSNQIAVNMALAVDLNKDGQRQANEPVIRTGQEPWTDTGTDGVADLGEPGYDPVANPDPNQDDYDAQINPSGTENDHRWQPGEPFQDLGLDGVANTAQLSNGGYDFGEGDGQYNMASGLQNFYGNDPHSMLQGSVTPPAGPLDNASLQRLDVWSDGGVRDLFNFGAVANHLEGAIAARLNPDGSPVKTTAFYNGFENLPGEDPTQPDGFLAANILWADVVDAPSMRYGTIDATPQQILNGDGQHVGTGEQILYRLVSSFYFAASKWPDADRAVPDSLDPDPTSPTFNAESTTVNQLGTACEINGRCEEYFTGPTTNRTGPIAVTLPPGYALEANRLRNVRYPVLFVLHGYGQDPRALEATAAITNNYMTDSQRSSADRLAKMIVVYVDGRCRMQNVVDPVTKKVVATVPECIRGTFYLNSNRSVDGVGIARLDDWFEEVMTHIDQNYRTQGPSDIDVVE